MYLSVAVVELLAFGVAAEKPLGGARRWGHGRGWFMRCGRLLFYMLRTKKMRMVLLASTTAQASTARELEHPFLRVLTRPFVDEHLHSRERVNVDGDVAQPSLLRALA